MRTRTLFLSLALASMPALAQNSADQAGTMSPQEVQGNSMRGSDSMNTMDATASKNLETQKGAGSSKQHQDMMKSATRDIEGFRRDLAHMKEQTKAITDQSRRESMELNNDMWQNLIDHMDKRMTQMQDMMVSGDGKVCTTTSAKTDVKRYSQ